MSTAVAFTRRHIVLVVYLLGAVATALVADSTETVFTYIGAFILGAGVTAYDALRNPEPVRS